eukprot:Clim_evm5s182 gene=Clim_evmTU5s182
MGRGSMPRWRFGRTIINRNISYLESRPIHLGDKAQEVQITLGQDGKAGARGLRSFVNYTLPAVYFHNSERINFVVRKPARGEPGDRSLQLGIKLKDGKLISNDCYNMTPEEIHDLVLKIGNGSVSETTYPINAGRVKQRQETAVQQSISLQQRRNEQAPLIKTRPKFTGEGLS